MLGCKSNDGAIFRMMAIAVVVLMAARFAWGAEHPRPAPDIGHQRHSELANAERAPSASTDLMAPLPPAVRRIGRWLTLWYGHTPPSERVTWAGMTACVGLGLMVLLERLVRLRRRKIVPARFTARFLDRLHEGKLDCGQALDFCELNPSPAARVALAAVRRWGRPAADLERAVALAHRVETERLRRNVGSLRRIAVLTPLLGLLGTLFALGHTLEGGTAVPASGTGASTSGLTAMAPAAVRIAWGPVVSAALTPLSTGIVIAILALVAYDGLLIRIEKLAGGLDRLGAETIDAIAMTAPISPPMTLAPSALRSSVSNQEAAHEGPVVPARAPHQPHIRPDEGRGRVRRSGQEESGF
jgi:biopolymer transport protein ExbB